jgi:phospholipid transport system transporter-binding protein
LFKNQIKTDAVTRVVTSAGQVVVTGPLTFQTVPPLVPEAAAWLQQGDGEIRVDLSGVSRADSAGVALLLDWWNTLHAAQRSLRYTNVPNQVETFIRINRLDSILLK